MFAPYHIDCARGVAGRRCVILSFVFLLALTAATPPLPAANGTWSSTASSGTWQTTTNWLSGIVPGATSGTTNTDTATFNSSSPVTLISPDANRNLDNITFDTSAAQYTIGLSIGNGLVLTSGGEIQIASTFSGSNLTESVGAPLTLEGNYTFADNASNTGDLLSFGGAITSGTAGTQTLTVSGADTTTINSVIGGGTGTIALVKSGNGQLTLNGNNTFTGGVTINAGTLLVSNTGALNSGTPNTITFGAGTTGTLDLNVSNITVAGLITNATLGAPIVENNNGVVATLTVNNASADTYGGVLQSANGGLLSLVKVGAGTLTLSGNNSVAGVTVQQGTLSVPTVNNLGASGPLGINGVVLGAMTQAGTLEYTGGTASSSMSFTLANGGGGAFQIDSVLTHLTLSGVVSGGGSLTKSGPGTLILGGNNTFTGGVTINAGDLIVSSPGALNSAAPNAVVFGSGNSPTLDLGVSVTVSGLISNPAAVAFVFGEGTSTTTLTVNNSVTNNFAGRLFDDASPLALVKSGAGTLILSDNNNFSGGVTINAGTLQLNASAALFGPTPNVVTFGAGSTGTLDLNGSIATIGGLNTNSLVGTPVVTNSSSAPRTLEVLVAGGNSTYAGVLQDGPTPGSLLLLKTGPGTLTLTGANTFTAPVNINGGTLAMSGGSLAADVVNNATFVYNSGTFNGGLTNNGTVTFNSPFAVGATLTNNATLNIGTGQSITANGPFNNNGTINNATGGTVAINSPALAFNRGNFNLSGTLTLSADQGLANVGSLTLNGGLVNGPSAFGLDNDFGGTITGTGTIAAAFSNSNGAIVIGPGTINITNNFANSGAIQLAAINADLSGGFIMSTGTIQGFGNVGNQIINTSGGTVEASGGTLFLTGSVSNSSGGTLTADAGAKLLITQGLTGTNTGVINLTGGTFDNNGHPLINASGGQISGWGIFRTGGTGLNNNGSITFSGGQTTVNGPITNEGGKTITVAQNNAIFTGLVTNNASATFNTVNAVATFAGGFVNNGNSNFVKAGGGTVEIDSAPTLNNGSTLSVTTGTLRFNVVSGAPTIGTGVTATVSSGATLELAGTVSALANGSNRVNVSNNSNAPGILASGTNQQVGNIDGSGTTQVNAGSDLTANHIIQATLVIGGTSKNPGLVTIDASDAAGNPLAVAFLATALQESRAPLMLEGDVAVSSFEGDDSEIVSSGEATSSIVSEAAAVPEPSSLILLGAAGIVIGGAAFCRRLRRR